jgi:membrane protease subunit (stomatin/prohibitin family)
MTKMNLHKSLAAKILLGTIALLMVTEPAWAILGVWRRAAVRTAVVVGSASAADASRAAAANANAAAASEAASAAAAQQSAAASAAAAQKAEAAAATPANTPQQKLKELQSLYDQGLISASEYQASKQKILNSMTQ